MSRIPLGQTTEYPQEYAPDVLCPVARSDARESLRLRGALPFSGIDIWNAWELTWLDAGGKPVIATATFHVDAASPNIIESKSLKLYLGSFAMSRFSSAEDLRCCIAADLRSIAGAEVRVHLSPGSADANCKIRELPGRCVDDLESCAAWNDVDAGLLQADADDVVEEELHSHLLRSLCPVTNQPDYGSVLLRYEGPRINPVSFLNYVISFRQHQDFHEACVERMFLDIKTRCTPAGLSVYARFNRRGGLDINPFRSNFESDVPNLRLWRQ